MSVLVAAIGSSHGADSLGWLVADHLATRLISGGSPVVFPDGVDLVRDISVRKFLHPTAALSVTPNFSHVLFVDAVHSETHEYGELLSVNAHELTPGLCDFSSHATGLNDAICLGRELNMLPSNCIVMGLNVYPFDELPVATSLRQKLITALWVEIVATFNMMALH